MGAVPIIARILTRMLEGLSWRTGFSNRQYSMLEGKPGIRTIRTMVILFTVFAGAPVSTYPAPGTLPPKPGYVLHFDFISDVRDALALLSIAERAGAKVINVVPPAHIWENKFALDLFGTILDEIGRRRLSLVISRIDASYPPDEGGKRYNYLYGRILSEPGRMPDGETTTEYFLATAGRDGYDEWMEEETRYYAEHYGGLTNLIGINLGPFSEPFTSQRGGFLEYTDSTRSYELTQYTPSALRLWHRWLTVHFKEVSSLNEAYGASFGAFDAVPMPLNENDARFGRPQVAYFDSHGHTSTNF